MSGDKEKIFITGGAGFVGVNVLDCLIRKGYPDIKLYDNLSTGRREYIKHVVSAFGPCQTSKSKNKTTYRFDFLKKRRLVTLSEADITDQEALIKEVRGYDAIIHLAAHTRVVESLNIPSYCFTVNVVGTFNVLEAARKNNIKKVIFASSNAAVGEQIPPINETMVTRPLSPYGASKLYGEALCSAYFHSYGIRTAALRFANAYGPYCAHKTSVVAKFIRRAKHNKSLEIYGDGLQTRDFIHVQDICQAIVSCLNSRLSSKKGTIWGEVFQIATGRETKIIDLAHMVKDLMDSSAQAPLKIIFRGQRKGEIRKNYSDIGKAKRLLAFKPATALAEGLEKLVNQKGIEFKIKDEELGADL